MPLRLPPARWLIAGCLAASFVAAPSSALAVSNCANVDVVVARGSSEPTDGSSPLGLDGIDADTSVYAFIKKELEQPSDGSTPISQQRLYDNDGDGQLDPGSIKRTNVVYPASLPIPSIAYDQQKLVADSAVFKSSNAAGVIWTIQYLNAAAVDCPQTRFVLLGYSQGALVMNNVVSAPAQRVLADPTPTYELTTAAKQRVIAIANFADAGRRSDDPLVKHPQTLFDGTAPTYLQNTGDDLNRGMTDGNSPDDHRGLWPRPSGALDAFKGRIRHYCVVNDVVCDYAANNSNLLPHIQYGDVTKAIRRKILAVFPIQKVRNEADKTYANAQCTFTSATNPDVLQWGMSVTLRFQASVDDRAVAGGTNKTDKLRATLSFNSNQASLLQAALGNPSAIRRAVISLPVTYRENASGTIITQDKQLLSYNDTVIPFSGSGFGVGIPGGSQAANTQSATWSFIASGYADLLLGDEFTVLIYGQERGTAWFDCSLGQTTTAFAGRHFGRIVVD